MTRDGFRNVSLKEEVHSRLTDVANILKKTRPDAVKSLVDEFLLHHHEQETIKAQMEDATK